MAYGKQPPRQFQTRQDELSQKRDETDWRTPEYPPSSSLPKQTDQIGTHLFQRCVHGAGPVMLHDRHVFQPCTG